jgi:hypothetical protein
MREAEKGVQVDDYMAGKLNELADKHGLPRVC